jgi:hypothetical protein
MADATVRTRELNLCKSIKSGKVIKAMCRSSCVEILGEDTWLRVRTRDGLEGYVFRDFIEIDAPKEVLETDRDVLSENCVLERYKHERFIGETVTVDLDFFPFSDKIAEEAEKCKLSIYATSSARDPGGQVVNAIVNPSKRSNHHIGRAIDMNLQSDSSTFFNSYKLKRLQQQPEYVRRFIGIRMFSTQI